MKVSKTRLGRLFNLLAIFLLLAVVTYGFMSLIYWDYNIENWRGFGRFLLGAEAVVFIIKVIDEV